MTDEVSTQEARVQKMLRRTATWLDWVAESYEALAKLSDVPDEVEGFMESAKWSREFAAAIRTDIIPHCADRN